MGAWMEMGEKAILALEDGSLYEGFPFGARGTTCGEVVFNTSMTGYQEMLTDPSYGGQIVAPTYPLIGNYGINNVDSESNLIQVRGFVVRETCPQPSHWQSNTTLHQWLEENNVPGIWGVDTRALTRRLRSAGVMMGVLSSELSGREALELLSSQPGYGSIDFVKEVTPEASYHWESPRRPDNVIPHHIVAIDCGLKRNIFRILHGLGCSLSALPCTATAEEVLNLRPDGIVLSPGPGDPALLGYLEGTVKQLIGRKPIMGICLGHQVLARALGATTFKLKFGHRGANHPVQDLGSQRVYITTQNHGYAVDADSLKGGLEVSHVNLNDGTVEGLRHRHLPIFSIQYHSEASPGPLDSVHMFDNFLQML